MFQLFKLFNWPILYLRMLDNAVKQRFIEFSVIMLVVFVWTALENLLKLNVTVNTEFDGVKTRRIMLNLKKSFNVNFLSLVYILEYFIE